MNVPHEAADEFEKLLSEANSLEKQIGFLRESSSLNNNDIDYINSLVDRYNRIKTKLDRSGGL